MTPAQRASTELVAVSVDDRPKIQMMLDRVAKEYGGPTPDFTFLTDVENKVINRYGLLNTMSKSPLPHPTVYVIDKTGMVRWKFTEVNYKIRPTNEMILKALGELK